jgi:shikimate 5-dehydrogenase
MNGDTMLLHQTAAAFRLWTGRDIGLDVLQKRLDQTRSDTATVSA